MQLVMDAQDVTLSLMGPGATFVAQDGSDGVVPDGKLALVVHSVNHALVVVGTPQQLRQHVYDGLCLPVPDGVPLVDEQV